MRGGEKCLEVFCELFPSATVFTLVHKKNSVSHVIEKMDIKTSFLQNFPGITEKYRNFLPLFPRAIESFDLSGYDLVLSSSHCVAKGVRRPERALHICYCHTPMRYAWKFFDEYFSREMLLKRWLISRAISGLKKWDLKANERVDYFISISENIRKRINDYYGRVSDIIYPPVDLGACCLSYRDEGYYLVVSALVPYKKVDLAVEAFLENHKPLVVVGTGTDYDRLRKISGESGNIKLTGWVSDSDLKNYFSRCKALVFPGDEDFGIVPVEAQAYGKPVIAYAAGGALETVVPFGSGPRGEEKPTGVFFREQTTRSLNEAIRTFEENGPSFIPDRIRDNAVRFSRDRFKEEINGYVSEKWRDFKKNGKKILEGARGHEDKA